MTEINDKLVWHVMQPNIMGHAPKAMAHSCPCRRIPDAFPTRYLYANQLCNHLNRAARA